MRAQRALSQAVNDFVAEGGKILASDAPSIEETTDRSSRSSLPLRPSFPDRAAQPASIEPEDASELGSMAQELEALKKGATGGLDDRQRLMSAYCIHYDGRRYLYGAYHYDRLADAVAYARLMQSRQQDCAPPLMQHDAVESPSPADRVLMAHLSISFEGGVYRFGGFHYDHLVDAVNYAKMSKRKQDARFAREPR
jgi:hypothetical protein